MKKIILISISLIIVATAAFFINQKNTPVDDSEGFLYNNPEIGVSFTIPTGYIVKENIPQSVDGSLIKAITIISEVDNNKPIPEGGEGPAVITLNVFNNKLKQFPGVWAEGNIQYSNYNLKTSEVTEEIIGGANAVGYSADGLYPSRVTVVAHGEFMYVFSGQYLQKDSPIVADYLTIIKSVNFIPNQNQTVSGKIDINTVCEGALMYMSFTDGEAANLFVKECKEGKHPEVIERFKKDREVQDGAQI